MKMTQDMTLPGDRSEVTTTVENIALGVAIVGAVVAVGSVISVLRHPYAQWRSENTTAPTSAYVVERITGGAYVGLPVAGIFGTVVAATSNQYQMAGKAAAVAGFGGNALLWAWIFRGVPK